MVLQRRHLLALLVTVAGHLGLGLAVGSGSYREATRVPGSERAAVGVDRAALVVYLTEPDRAAMTAPSPESPQGGQAEPAAAEARQAPPAQRLQEAPPVQAAKPALHHFPLSALTQAPQVASGLVGEALLVVPGIEARKASIQVWINDQGDVDRVAIEDADLSEERKQWVIAAFSAVRFSPGRIGRIPVGSEMRMDILLESELKL